MKTEKSKFIQKAVSKPIVKQAVAPEVAKKKPQLSQRDQYAKAMNGAQSNGGSNGIGVGY